MRKFPEKENPLKDVGKVKINVPLDKLVKVDAKRRHWLRTAVKKIETLQKYAIYQLRGFEYHIKMGWNGMNPYIRVEIVLENVDERLSFSDVGIPEDEDE